MKRITRRRFLRSNILELKASFHTPYHHLHSLNSRLKEATRIINPWLSYVLKSQKVTRMSLSKGLGQRRHTDHSVVNETYEVQWSRNGFSPSSPIFFYWTDEILSNRSKRIEDMISFPSLCWFYYQSPARSLLFFFSMLLILRDNCSLLPPSAPSLRTDKAVSGASWEYLSEPLTLPVSAIIVESFKSVLQLSENLHEMRWGIDWNRLKTPYHTAAGIFSPLIQTRMSVAVPLVGLVSTTATPRSHIERCVAYRKVLPTHFWEHFRSDTTSWIGSTGISEISRETSNWSLPDSSKREELLSHGMLCRPPTPATSKTTRSRFSNRNGWKLKSSTFPRRVWSMWHVRQPAPRLVALLDRDILSAMN